MTSIIIYTAPPKDFTLQERVAGCFFEHGHKLLLLKRHSSRSQGETWCIPSGRENPGESAEEAAIRETWEETGLVIKKKDLIYIGKLYARLPEIDYVFTMFRVKLKKMPERIKLHQGEHSEWGFFTLEEAFKLPLILGGKEALKAAYKNASIE